MNIEIPRSWLADSCRIRCEALSGDLIAVWQDGDSRLIVVDLNTAKRVVDASMPVSGAFDVRAGGGDRVAVRHNAPQHQLLLVSAKEPDRILSSVAAPGTYDFAVHEHSWVVSRFHAGHALDVLSDDGSRRSSLIAVGSLTKAATLSDGEVPAHIRWSALVRVSLDGTVMVAFVYTGVIVAVRLSGEVLWQSSFEQLGQRRTAPVRFDSIASAIPGSTGVLTPQTQALAVGSAIAVLHPVEDGAGTVSVWSLAGDLRSVTSCPTDTVGIWWNEDRLMAAALAGDALAISEVVTQ